MSTDTVIQPEQKEPAQAIEGKKWWQKQRTWAMVLGVVGTICGVIPAVNVASVPILTIAGLLGFKGLSDSQTRVETTTAKNATKLASLENAEAAPPC